MYYVSVLAVKHEKGKTSPTVIADMKVPFKVRVSDLYYRAFSSTATSTPTAIDSFIKLPAALRTRVHHHRTHPPPLKGGHEDRGEGHRHNGTVGESEESADARVARLVERTRSRGANARGSRDREADATLPLPARRGLFFAPETMQRTLEGGRDGAKGHRRALSLSPAASPAPSPYPGITPSLIDSLPPLPPPLPPPSDVRSIQALLHRYKAVQLAGDPLASSLLPYPAHPSTLTTFLTSIRTPQSFNISEQSNTHPHLPPPHPPSTSPPPPAPTSLPITLVTLERSAFRPGDTVRGHFDFSTAVLPTYRIVAHLAWVEDLRALRPPQGRHTTIVASEHWHCKQAQWLPFALALPADATCNFASELVRGHWRVQFKFVVGGTQKVKEVKKGGGGWFGGGSGGKVEEDDEEARREKERVSAGWSVFEKEGAVSSGAIVSALIAPDASLSMSCLQWELPLDVVPVYEDTQVQPSIKSLLIDVEER